MILFWKGPLRLEWCCCRQLGLVLHFFFEGEAENKHTTLPNHWYSVRGRNGDPAPCSRGPVQPPCLILFYIYTGGASAYARTDTLHFPSKTTESQLLRLSLPTAFGDCRSKMFIVLFKTKSKSKFWTISVHCDPWAVTKSLFFFSFFPDWASSLIYPECLTCLHRKCISP